MFASRDRGTVIAKGLKIVGSVTAEGLSRSTAKLTAKFTAPPSKSHAGPASPEQSPLTASSLTAKLRVPFKAVR